jgi:hypothetical protein
MKIVYSFIVVAFSFLFLSCNKCTLCTKTDEKNRTFMYPEYCGKKKKVAEYEENLIKTAEEKTVITCKRIDD